MIPIQITCPNAEVPLSIMREIKSDLHRTFNRFTHFVREAHVTLRDTNGPRGGLDKLCTVQLRLFPRGLAVVKSSGASFPEAANMACDKMRNVVAKRLNKRNDAQVKNREH